jgi:hypothetical protein
VPIIKHFDLSADNGIETCYVLQQRIAGAPAVKIYQQLNNDQKIRFAKHLGEAIPEMARHLQSCAGVLNPDSARDHASHPTVFCFAVPHAEALSNLMNSSPRVQGIPSVEQNPLEMMRELFGRQYAEDEKRSRTLLSPWKSFEKVAETMCELGLLETNAIISRIWNSSPAT